MSDASQLRDLEQLSRVTGGDVLVVGKDGGIRHHSAGAAGLLGATEQEQLDAAWSPVHRRVQQALAERNGAGGEVTLDVPLDPGSRDGRLVLRVLPLRDGESGGYVASLCERRALDALHTDLQRAAQMRHLHATCRQAAHDLRAPLNAIALNLELIRQDLDDDARAAARERIELLRREVTRLSRMLQVLLVQSEPPRQRARVFGLRRLLREMLELVGPQAGRLGVRIGLSVPGHGIAVFVARDALKQALLNLLLNALEAMPHGGPLELELAENDGRAVVTIRDHGVGIPERHLDRLFRMHFTTKPGGSGIGLFTSRAAIESMGGALTLESREHVGTTARIELPIAAPDASEVPCFTS